MKAQAKLFFTKLRTVLQRLTYWNYHSAKAFETVWFHFVNFRKKEPLLIYQMGKVGSSTISKSLNSLKLNRSIYHVHVLTRKNLDLIESVLKRSFYVYPSVPSHVIRASYLRKKIAKSSNGDRKWQVTTLVRDPIARNLSSFFQDIRTRHPEFDYQRKAEMMPKEDFLAELIRLFLDKHDHDRPLLWFDMELKQVFDIDVFASEFQRSQGYKIYRGDKAEVLLLKLENIDQCAQEAFREFININQFNLVNFNLARRKPYYPIYRSFLDKIVVPEAYIDRMYSSKLVRHFYSQEEIEQFKVKWRRGNPTVWTRGTGLLERSPAMPQRGQP